MAAASPELDDVCEWVSFEAPDRTWLLDVTFLTSAWQCIWDAGCPGVLETPAPELAQGCCSHGAHFADHADVARVRRAAASLTPAQWQHQRDVDDALVVDTADEAGIEPTWTTALVDDACVFLNRPGFDGGHGCALHRLAVETGVSHLATKPEVCWQLPLRLEHHEDENGHLVSTLRRWRRHDWGSAGASFSWWCTDSSEAHVAATPVVDRLREEIAALVGPRVLEALDRYLDGRSRGVAVDAPTRRST